MRRVLRHRLVVLALAGVLFAPSQLDAQEQVTCQVWVDYLTDWYVTSQHLLELEVGTKTLFSGDLFGAFSEDWDLYAKDDYNKKMEVFHAPYMPSKEILKAGMEKLEKLDLELIASQHGSVIKKDRIKDSIKFLKNLECGLYLKGK